jgi:hypothetical protein
VLGFSFKAILIKLAYAAYPVDAVTLLALRMLYSAPFFVAMAWWAGRGPSARNFTRDDWTQVALLGFIGYYLASLLDFLGLQYVTAAFERLVLFLYPTIVVLLSALWQGVRVTRRTVLALIVCYAGIAVVFASDLRAARDSGAVLEGGALVFGSAFLYAIYLVRAGPVIARMGSTRFIAWAMLVSAVFVLAQFALGQPRQAGSAALDSAPRACDGRILDRAADVADRRGRAENRRECIVANRLARPGLHDLPGRAPARRAGPGHPARRRGARAGRRDARRTETGGLGPAVATCVMYGAFAIAGRRELQRMTGPHCAAGAGPAAAPRPRSAGGSGSRGA